ncbi:MAG: hypothetical protein AB7U75_06270 [Hyphomicrobiaceae bacterium]
MAKLKPKQKPKVMEFDVVGDSRTAPDPFAAVLPAIAALGAISSIATINWVAEERTGNRPKAKRKPGTALRDLESCCLGLVEIFRRFKRNPKVYAGEGAQGASPLKFGVHGRRVEAEACRVYHQLMNDVASMLVLASQNSFDVMCAIEDGYIEAPEEIFFGFGEQQERLNGLIQNRATLKQTVDTGLEVALRLHDLVAALKAHKVD